MLAPNPSVTVKLTEAFTSAEANSLQSGFGVVSNQAVNFNGDGQHRGRYVQVALESADEFGQGRGAGLRPPSGPEDELLVIENIQPGRYWVRVDSSRGYSASVSSGGVMFCQLLPPSCVTWISPSSVPIQIRFASLGEGAIE